MPAPASAKPNATTSALCAAGGEDEVAEYVDGRAGGEHRAWSGPVIPSTPRPTTPPSLPRCARRRSGSPARSPRSRVRTGEVSNSVDRRISKVVATLPNSNKATGSSARNIRHRAAHRIRTAVGRAFAGAIPLLASRAAPGLRRPRTDQESRPDTARAECRPRPPTRRRATGPPRAEVIARALEPKCSAARPLRAQRGQQRIARGRPHARDIQASRERAQPATA